MSAQQLVILSPEPSRDSGLAPLGTHEEIVAALGRLNIAPERPGETMLYGPGIRIEMSPDSPVTQMLLTITEEEIAWLVIMRVAKAMHWKLRDLATGRELAPA